MVLKKIFLGVLSAIALSVVAQTPIDNLPVRIVDGTAFHYYEVQPKETVYSLCKKLEISQERLMELNPSVADGLKAGQTLYFPAAPGQTARIHVVKPKETLYGIGKLYGITPDQICQWNPSAVDGIRPGQRLVVSEPVEGEPIAKPLDYAPVAENPEGYVIKQGDTLYSIAIANSTTVSAILSANPELDRDNYKAGTIISLPKKTDTDISGLVEEPKPVIINPVNTPDTVAVYQNPVYAAVVDVDSATVDDSYRMTVANQMTIALTLPFMLSGDEQSRQAQLYTEFYKGFLLAVDEMRDCGTPINIMTFDSSDSAGIAGILSQPQILDADLIIASDNQEQLILLGEFGRENDIDILNLFLVKDEAYLTNPVIMQGNIPHRNMYRKAIEGLMKKIGTHKPVILTRKNGEKDKEEYIEMLKAHLTEAGIDFQEIFFDGTMGVSALDELDADGQYAFIPTSGKQVELNRVLPAIIDFKAKSMVADPVMVFGYPEWITFRGETLSNMHKANCIVYSRFFSDPDAPAVKRVEDKFTQWYGTPMANFMPRQGLFGYDTGMFVINWLRTAETEPQSWEGVQNGFDFEQITDGGKMNSKLYFINYLPGGIIERKAL